MKRRLLLIGGAWIVIPWTMGIALEMSKNRRRRADAAKGDEGEGDGEDRA